MRTITCVLSVLLFTTILLNAQQTGLVNYEQIGIKFTIPDGWVGQEGDGLFIMGSNTTPGLILVTTHEYKTKQELKAAAQEGLVEEGGTNLTFASASFDELSNGIGAEFQGTLEWTPAKAYILSLISPNTYGVTIMAMTDNANYSGVYKELAMKVARSVQFSKPNTVPIVAQWKKKFQNARLTYMNSYYSSDYTGGYASSSTKIYIDICAAGYFNYSSSSQSSVDAGGGLGSYSGGGAYLSDQGSGNGKWEIVGGLDGNALLRLNFYNGEVSEYSITTDGSKTFLNGSRYFVTYDGEYAPNCY